MNCKIQSGYNTSQWGVLALLDRVNTAVNEAENRLLAIFAVVSLCVFAMRVAEVIV